MMEPTYTFAEIAYVDSQVGDRAQARDIVLGLGVPLNARMAINGSERLREQNVVALYHDCGEHYGEAIHTFLEAVLSTGLFQESTGKRYTLGQMAWLRNIAMFAGNMRDDMQSMGASDSTSEFMSASCLAAKRNIASWWMQVHQDHSELAQSYIDDQLKSYKQGWPHLGANTPAMDP